MDQLHRKAAGPQQKLPVHKLDWTLSFTAPRWAPKIPCIWIYLSQGRIQKFWKGGVRTFESQVRVKRGMAAEAERPVVWGPLKAPRTPHILDGLRCILSSQ